MKKILSFLSVLVLLCSCAHRIVRDGYNIRKSDYKNCEILITKNQNIPADSVNKLGEIKLGESGFSVVCNEKKAVEILKAEACAIGADLVVVTDEKRTDFWSSCYRCKAEFYQITNPALKLVVNNYYDDNQVKERVKQDHRKMTAMSVAAFALGFTFGLLVL